MNRRNPFRKALTWGDLIQYLEENGFSSGCNGYLDRGLPVGVSEFVDKHKLYREKVDKALTDFGVGCDCAVKVLLEGRQNKEIPR